MRLGPGLHSTQLGPACATRTRERSGRFRRLSKVSDRRAHFSSPRAPGGRWGHVPLCMVWPSPGMTTRTARHRVRPTPIRGNRRSSRARPQAGPAIGDAPPCGRRVAQESSTTGPPPSVGGSMSAVGEHEHGCPAIGRSAVAEEALEVVPPALRRSVDEERASMFTRRIGQVGPRDHHGEEPRRAHPEDYAKVVAGVAR